MQPIPLDDPAWLATFPHLVAPYNDEWLMGLLLRCDEVNGWGSKTTLAHALRLGPEKFHRCWYTETPNLVVIPHCSLNLDYLAQLLALPRRTLLGTTYHVEMSRLFGQIDPHSRDINPSFSFHVCPECVAEARLLLRTLTLPHITLCPQHRVILLKQCRCGASLCLFYRKTSPFTCYVCGMNWANLPRIEASQEHLVRNQQLWSWYAWFLSPQATPELFHWAGYFAANVPSEKQKRAIVLEVQRSIRRSSVERTRFLPWPRPMQSLSWLIAQLVDNNISPQTVRQALLEGGTRPVFSLPQVKDFT